MKIQNAVVYGFEPAFRGMRNSWSKSDSVNTVNFEYEDQMAEDLTLGESDLKLAQTLVRQEMNMGSFLG